MVSDFKYGLFISGNFSSLKLNILPKFISNFQEMDGSNSLSWKIQTFLFVLRFVLIAAY